MSSSSPLRDQMKRPWIAMQIETTLWSIPYWLRRLAQRRVDKWYDVKWTPEGFVELEGNEDESVQA